MKTEAHGLVAKPQEQQQIVSRTVRANIHAVTHREVVKHPDNVTNVTHGEH